MPRPFALTISLADEARDHLEALVRARSPPQALALRCRIVLLAAADEHPSNQEIAAHPGCERHTVGPWRERFAKHGLPGLQDAPRSGRPGKFSPRGPGRRHHPGQ